MKTMLLILMAMASAALAGDREINMAMAGDRQIKALLVGTWTNPYDQTITVFRADGIWLMGANDTEPYDKWDIKDGQLLDIRPAPKGAHSFTILFLTKHEFLALVNRGDGRNYIFLKR